MFISQSSRLKLPLSSRCAGAPQALATAFIGPSITIPMVTAPTGHVFIFSARLLVIGHVLAAF
jgi:hypothetical protein